MSSQLKARTFDGFDSRKPVMLCNNDILCWEYCLMLHLKWVSCECLCSSNETPVQPSCQSFSSRHRRYDYPRFLPFHYRGPPFACGAIDRDASASRLFHWALIILALSSRSCSLTASSMLSRTLSTVVMWLASVLSSLKRGSPLGSFL